jgi:hypothetical protein
VWWQSEWIDGGGGDGGGQQKVHTHTATLAYASSAIWKQWYVSSILKVMRTRRHLNTSYHRSFGVCVYGGVESQAGSPKDSKETVLSDRDDYMRHHCCWRERRAGAYFQNDRQRKRFRLIQILVERCSPCTPRCLDGMAFHFNSLEWCPTQHL